MKNSQWIGIAAVVLMAVACFMPWAFFPGPQKEFTGFFSEQNSYGRPGKVFIALGVIEIVLFLTPKVWAKRANIFVTAIGFAWGIKSFYLYGACYLGTCPERRIGIFLVLAGTLIAMVASFLPRLDIKEETDRG